MTAGTAAAGSAAAQQAPPSLEPYKGLAPYLESDSALFFGREREIEIICANLMAARLTLLYGESGVGKSSVLLAGAVHRLREEARRNLDDYGRAEFLVVAYRSWRDDPVQGLIAEIRRAVENLRGVDAAVSLPESGSLVDVLRAASGCADCDVIVVLDQFDEYFLYHGTEDGEGTFAVEFPRAVNQEDLRASFLVSMREDTVAKLDRFKGRIPILFDNRLRIDHLGIEAAREAIERPLHAYNEQREADAAIEIEPELVDRILSEITGRSVALGQVGAGDVGRGSPGLVDDRIQAPYLQVVLRRLWLEEVKAGSQVLRAETLERLGGCENIVRTRLAELMDALEPEERDVAAAVFRFLVTRSGAKVAHTASDLADFSGLPVEDVASVLEQLAAPDVRLLRSVEAAAGDDGGTSFEIAHDVIGPAILNWRTHYEQEGRVRKERRRTRIAVGVAAVSVLGCIAVAVLAVWAVRSQQRASDAKEEARAQELSARAQELAARARAARADDPVRAVTLALEALEASENTEQAEAVLREALPELRVRRIVEGVGDPVAAAISGEGRPLLALAAEDQGARVVDAETGESVTLAGFEGSVLSSSFNADGSRLATTSSDGTASLWNTTTGEEIAPLPGGDGAALVAFDPSGRYVVGADYSGLLYLWSGESGAALDQARGGYEGAFVWRVSFSGDGSRLATVSDDGLEVRLFAVSASGLQEEGQLLPGVGAFTGPPAPTAATGPQAVGGSTMASGQAGAIDSAELNPKGSLLLTADRSGRVQLWNAATLRAVRTFSGGGGDTLDLAFSPQGNLVAAAQQKLVRIWRTANVEPVAELRGHEDWVNAVEFRADGQNVLSASSDGTARVWEARTGVPVLELTGHRGPVTYAGYLPGDEQVATVSEDGTARVWDVGTGAELRGHGDWVLDSTLSADGTRLATVGADGRLIWWNPKTRERLDDVLVDSSLDPVNSVEVSPDGDAILTAGTDGFADLWDAADLGYIGGASDHDSVVVSASFNPAGNRIVTASGDWTARVWDPEALDAALFTLTQGDSEVTHEGVVYDAAFSPVDGSRIVTVGADEAARVWSSEDGRLLGEFDGHDARVWSVAFDPVDPTLVVTGSPDRTARIWNVKTRVEVARLTQPESVTTAAFSSDGELIVTGSPGGVTRIWDWRSEKLLAAMRMHGDYVNAAEFAPDGTIVTASDDRTAKIYACETCVGLEALVKLAEARLAELGRPPAP